MRTGKYPENAYKRSVQKYLQKSHNRTITSLRQTALTYEMAPAVFLQDAVNEIYASKAEPLFFTAGLAVPPDLEEKTVSCLMKDLSQAGKKEGVPFSGAEVTTMENVLAPVLQITVMGEREAEPDTDCKRADVVLAGTVAMAGSGILAVTQESELLKKFSSPFIKQAQEFLSCLSVKKATQTAFQNGAVAGYSLGEGGVFAGLWRFAAMHGAGLSVDLRAIPIRQETVEICECFQLNPYQLLSTGAILLSTPNGADLVEVLHGEGVEAELIGSIREGNDKVVCNDTETRYLELPQEDEIHRFFGRQDK